MAQLPLTLLCSTKFGRHPKISVEQVYNMFQADGWMVNYAGYREAFYWVLSGVGRGIFYSSRSNRAFAVIGNSVQMVTFKNNIPTTSEIGKIGTSDGNIDVFIDENIQSQVFFCDKTSIYIYDYSSGVFEKLNIDFTPNYICYQDNRIIAAIYSSNTFIQPYRTPGWRLSDENILSIVTATLVDGGLGYQVDDELTVVNRKLNASTGKIKVDEIDGSGTILDYSVLASGAGYANAVIYETLGGNGTGATFTVITSNNHTAGSGFTGGFAAAPEQIGTFQNKSDDVVACVRFPGKVGQLLVMGSISTEVWNNLGLKLFPYQRNNGYSIDYGCMNPATIAAGDDFIVWLATNEKSGPSIMYCAGGVVNTISTDGINYRLSQLSNPENSFGFIVKQDGHVFYQLTFPSDDVTYTYDFNTQKFYTLSDASQNCHIARRVAYCNNAYYFISYNDYNLYKMSSAYTDYNGHEIPRIIVTSTSAKADRTPFIVKKITFPIEQGHRYDDEIARIDISTSSDGGVTFGGSKGEVLNGVGKRRNILESYNLGRYNEITFQFRFWGKGRFVLGDGVVDIT